MKHVLTIGAVALLAFAGGLSVGLHGMTSILARETAITRQETVALTSQALPQSCKAAFADAVQAARASVPEPWPYAVAQALR